MSEPWDAVDPYLKAEAQQALEAGVSDDLAAQMRQLGADCIALADAIDRRDLRGAALEGEKVITAMISHVHDVQLAAILQAVHVAAHQRRQARQN